MLYSRALAKRFTALHLTIALAVSGVPMILQAQSEISREEVQPMGQWLEFRKARYGTRPILIHLRTGYERAVIMPEPIRLLDDNQTLPGSAVEIDTDVIGFYPTQEFARKSIKFIGLDSGFVYELRVRASPLGMRQPLQITR